MKVSRAGRNTKAFWRSQERWEEKWMAEKPITPDAKAYGQYQRTRERLQGHAAGWIAAVNWMRRQAKRP